jgi:protease-4
MIDENIPDPSAESSSERGEVWERDLVNRLAFAAINEQRRSRRWSVFFRFLLAIYLGALLIPLLIDASGDLSLSNEGHTAVVRLDGVIADKKDASADAVITALRSAFEDKNTKGVVLRINSPGGSPVQSGYINEEMTRLRAKYPDIPLYAVITDLCASGGYYVAVAADKIYADRNSLVGSIGVRMDGFGLVDAMHKLGVERRLITAGDHKGFLDPFQPEKPEEVAHVRTLLKDIHAQFIKVVKDGRGDRLKDSPDLFSGYIWTGQQAREMGMIDEFGSTSTVARDVIGAEETVDFTAKPKYLDRILTRFGSSVRDSLFSAFSAMELR